MKRPATDLGTTYIPYIIAGWNAAVVVTVGLYAALTAN